MEDYFSLGRLCSNNVVQVTCFANFYSGDPYTGSRDETVKKLHEEITNLQKENRQLKADLARAQRTYNVNSAGMRYLDSFINVVPYLESYRINHGGPPNRGFRSQFDGSAAEKRAR